MATPPRRKHHLFFTVLVAWRRVKFDLISCGAKETPFVSHVLFKKNATCTCTCSFILFLLVFIESVTLCVTKLHYNDNNFIHLPFLNTYLHRVSWRRYAKLAGTPDRQGRRRVRRLRVMPLVTAAPSGEGSGRPSVCRGSVVPGLV